MGDYTLDGYVVLGTDKTVCIMPNGMGRSFLVFM
jgi:hypothetical protein